MTMQQKKGISVFSIIVIFISFTLMGLALIPLLPIQLYPNDSKGYIRVSFSFPNQSPSSVEREVTSKLEGALSRVRGVESVSSSSSEGSGRIVLRLDKYTSIEEARFEASSIIHQVWDQIPREASYPSIYAGGQADHNKSNGLMSFILRAPGSPIEISTYAKEVIRPRLISEISGLSEVRVTDIAPVEWMLTYDNEQLNALGISYGDIRNAIQSYFFSQPIGMVPVYDHHQQLKRMALSIRSNDKQGRQFEPSKIIVKNLNGRLITLDQVVKIDHRDPLPSSYYRVNGKNTIAISLSSKKGENELLLSRKVMETVEKIKEVLPPGYILEKSYDVTDFIHKELNKIYFRSGLTILILILFVLIITQRWWYTSLILISFIINIGVALIFYYVSDVSIHLYSLAGITISLSLIIDNTIVMVDHYLRYRNRQVFMAILAATLTTIGALSLIFFLDDSIKVLFQDFSKVLIINLAVSLMVALFFVPAIVDKMKIKGQRVVALGASRRHLLLLFNRCYAFMLRGLLRFRWVAIIILILSFGFPTNLIPEKLDGYTSRERSYNRFMKKKVVRTYVYPAVKQLFGGTLRLFIEGRSSYNYGTRTSEPTLNVSAKMPEGSSLDQMNHVVTMMENYLRNFPEIRQFETSIRSAQEASIVIRFEEPYIRTAFPSKLKSKIIDKALKIGGGSWTVKGFDNYSFNNDVAGPKIADSYVKVTGYNYGEVIAWGETIKKALSEHSRVQDLYLGSSPYNIQAPHREQLLTIDKDRIGYMGISPSSLFGAVQQYMVGEHQVQWIVTPNGVEQVKLGSLQGEAFDIWRMKHQAFRTPSQTYKMYQLGEIEEGRYPRIISRENRQYVTYVLFHFLGDYELCHLITNKEIKKLLPQLPIGFKMEGKSFNSWSDREKANQVYLLFLLIVIVFFTTSVLFNSWRYPFAIICVIPISFIGVFLTFYYLGLAFDQGAFASLVLLCGITVNASIYLVTAYRDLRRMAPRLSPVQAYVKVWNLKIIPISLTVISTILGFVPFLVGMGKEPFWTPLAAGTIGGLLFSLIGIWIYLPLFLLPRKSQH